MANLQTKYMGIPLANPLVVGACSLTAHMDAIKKIEEHGAGALVIQSLFEEQIQLERYRHDEDLVMYDDWHAEMTNIFPEKEHSGPEEHLMWVRKAKEAVGIPVIASLNAVNPDSWVEWAQKLAETGVDGLELNFYAMPVHFDQTAQDIEQSQVETLRKVVDKVKLPVAVKLSPYYTSPLEFMKKLDATGVNGFVLFNRLFPPSFDIDKETANFPFNLSHSSDHRLALRFVGLLADNVKASLCASNGIHSGKDAIDVLLAGADAFQTVSSLYQNSVDHIQTILKEIEDWMQRKGYSSLEDFRGKLSVENTPDRWTYRRAQYVRMLLRSDEYIKRPKLV